MKILPRRYEKYVTFIAPPRKKSFSKLLQFLFLLTVSAVFGFYSPTLDNKFRFSADATAAGPLSVHPSNPRYFTDGSGKAIYLTGSNVGSELQDNAWGSPDVFDYDAFLDFLSSYNHNFFRMWSVEQTRWGSSPTVMATPMPFARSSTAGALDGGNKFNLDEFDQAYFDRLRSRVMAAGDRGIYVQIMLFQGFSSDHDGADDVNPWYAHPFNQSNNINRIEGDPNGDGWGREIHTSAIPAVTNLQKAYVKKVIDTVNDLDNVLYEICNECRIESKDWQYAMTNYIQDYEAGRIDGVAKKQHPVLMSHIWSEEGGTEDIADFIESPAEAIAPFVSAGEASSPSLGDGRKVIISDTDHHVLNGKPARIATWVWRAFLRGENLSVLDGGNIFPDPMWELPRRALGYTRIYADKMNLAAMTPRGDLTSTRYGLANPGSEYLIYALSGGRFTVKLSGTSRNFAVEWFNPSTGVSSDGGTVAGGQARSFRPPFKGPAVLYLNAG